MPYTSLTAISAKIPKAYINEALDDDADADPVKIAANLANLIAVITTGINGRLAAIYTVPFADPAPPKIQDFALTLVCEELTRRRNIPDDANKFFAEANRIRAELDKIGHGEIELDLTLARQFPPGAAITGQPKVNCTTL